MTRNHPGCNPFTVHPCLVCLVALMLFCFPGAMAWTSHNLVVLRCLGDCTTFFRLTCVDIPGGVLIIMQYPWQEKLTFHGMLMGLKSWRLMALALGTYAVAPAIGTYAMAAYGFRSWDLCRSDLYCSFRGRDLCHGVLWLPRLGPMS
ncbi:hypothetical protein COLO4_28177 [Corchorus olitorius]|uniref:Uncharacterized protein n=1 Tax=Corchorus olitorius TaxID=93759 RepID=A0A1R3HMP6_9ROSI|nr:hypothetical protein COLO4_28177 [Corchorus olitorius]